jgi:hypothetical protein
MATVRKTSERLRFNCKVKILSLQNKFDATIKLNGGIRIADIFTVRLINGTYYGRATVGKQSLRLCSDDCLTWFPR